MSLSSLVEIFPKLINIADVFYKNLKIANANFEAQPECLYVTILLNNNTNMK